MADIYSQHDTQCLLGEKNIVYIGDSNTRAQYKDLVWLLTSNTLINNTSLRRKLEESYLGDYLIRKSNLHRGRNFEEVRQMYFSDIGTFVEFMFITRCYNDQLEHFFRSIKNGRRQAPDVIVMNSCIWDITRWGPNGVPAYKDNMVKLMRLIKQSLPPKCLMIWTTTLPLGPHIKGGLVIKQVSCMEQMLRFEVVEANTIARSVVSNYGFDVLDYHFVIRMQVHRRAKDGLHYTQIPVRLMTNMLLTHIALSWGRSLPNNVSSVLLDRAINEVSKPALQPVTIPSANILSKTSINSPVVPKARGIKVTFTPDKDTRRSCILASSENKSQAESQAQLRSVVRVLNPDKPGPMRRRRNKHNKKRWNQPYNYRRMY